MHVFVDESKYLPDGQDEQFREVWEHYKQFESHFKQVLLEVW